MKYIARLTVLLLASGLWAVSAKAMPLGTVNIGEQVWLQPLDFVNSSWDDIAEVCNAVSGSCNGSIGGISLDGWIWASTDDVGAMFDTILGMEYFGAGNSSLGTPGVGDTAWATAFFDAGFLATYGGNDIGDGTPARFISGFTRSTYINGFYAQMAWVEDAFANGSPYRYDSARLVTMSSVSTSTSSETTGHFFYKAAVPEPGTFLLFALGLVGLLVSRVQARRFHI